MSPRTCLTLSCLFAPLIATAAPNMEEGNWQVTMKMKMEGVPFAMPPVTQNQCMTKKDMVPKASGKNASCDVKEQKVSGDTVTWHMVCTDAEGTSDTQGKITYHGARYEGTMQAKMTSKRGKVTNVNYEIQGRHTGACGAKADPKKNRKADDY
jgi:Protein of unknown function (DUF3617)